MPNLSPLKPADFRETRLRLKMTQGELAQILGVRRETVTLWETGKIRMPQYMVFTLIGLCHTFMPEKSGS